MTAPHDIAAQIAARGGRVTRARTALLEVLRAAGQALSHEEIAAALAARGVNPDRVTLYRNLDWLVANDLAHRISGGDRTGRFKAASDELQGHAHFHCERCHAIFCLEALQPAVVASLPAGFRVDHAELTLHGRCPNCR